MNPSQVFFGLSSGVILWRPRNVPVKYAAMSLHLGTQTVRASKSPACVVVGRNRIWVKQQGKNAKVTRIARSVRLNLWYRRSRFPIAVHFQQKRGDHRGDKRKQDGNKRH